MVQLILMISLFPQQPQVLARTPITTCQWPNPCATEKTQPALQARTPITTCQWPNPCAQENASHA